MGIAKKTDGRYLVGIGVDSVNDYKGSAAYRDIYIQLTSSGATAKSEEYLTFLKDYGFHANASGEPIMPPSVNVWISNNGVTTAVEADDVSIDGNNYTICGIKWNGSAWDYSAAGQGKSGSGLPPYTSADKGKVLTIGDTVETVYICPLQTAETGEYGNTWLDGYNSDTSQKLKTLINQGESGVLYVDGVVYEEDWFFKTMGDFSYPAIKHGDVELVWRDDSMRIQLSAALNTTYEVGVALQEAKTVENVIIPEQTGEFVNLSGYVGFDVVNADLDYFANIAVGDTCSLKLNGVDKTMVATDQYVMGAIAFVDTDFTCGLMPFYVDDTVTSVVFASSTASLGDTATISATASVPSVEPKWEAASGGGGGSGAVYLTDTNGTLSATYSEISALIDAGTVIYLKSTQSHGVIGLCPLAWLSDYGAHYTVVFTDVLSAGQDILYSAESDSAPLILEPDD